MVNSRILLARKRKRRKLVSPHLSLMLLSVVPKGVFKDTSLYYQIFDFIIMMVAMYDGFHIPFIIGF
jgi:hypothetical protein